MQCTKCLITRKIAFDRESVVVENQMKQATVFFICVSAQLDIRSNVEESGYL